MVFRKYGRELRAWAACNARLLAVKILVLGLKLFPAKLSFLRLLGWTHGIISMYRFRGLWPRINEFARHIGSTDGPRRFRRRTFVSKSQSRLFASLYYEASHTLDRYVRVSGLDALTRSASAGKGAILLGAHYGPQITGVLLSQRGLNIQAVFGSDWRPFVERTFHYGLPFLTRKRWLYVADVLKPAVSGKNEKQIISHLKDGGVAAMLVDLPRRAPGGVSAEFFGVPLRFNAFAFKAALRYDVPVFFYVIEKARGGYALRFERAVFGSVDEGLDRYIEFFEGVISLNPFLWEAVPTFTRWSWLNDPIRSGVRL